MFDDSFHHTVSYELSYSSELLLEIIDLCRKIPAQTSSRSSSGCQWHRRSQSRVLRDSLCSKCWLCFSISVQPLRSRSLLTLCSSLGHTWIDPVSSSERHALALLIPSASVSPPYTGQRKYYCALNAICALNTPNSWTRINIISMLWNQPSE